MLRKWEQMGTKDAPPLFLAGINFLLNKKRGNREKESLRGKRLFYKEGISKCSVLLCLQLQENLTSFFCSL